jgi:hypothetical protein
MKYKIIDIIKNNIPKYIKENPEKVRIAHIYLSTGDG